MSSTQTQDSFTMNPIDQRQLTTFQSESVTRRLQNRERQRRYRARKRLEAELNNSSTIKPSSSPNVIGTISDYTPRLYCKRDWKKDARRAHVSRDTEATANAYVSHTSGNQTVFHSGTTAEQNFESETYSEVSANPNNSEMSRHKVGRRDWKADARKKET